jgi:hypothetical protein
MGVMGLATGMAVLDERCSAELAAAALLVAPAPDPTAPMPLLPDVARAVADPAGPEDLAVVGGEFLCNPNRPTRLAEPGLEFEPPAEPALSMPWGRFGTSLLLPVAWLPTALLGRFGPGFDPAPAVRRPRLLTRSPCMGRVGVTAPGRGCSEYPLGA